MNFTIGQWIHVNEEKGFVLVSNKKEQKYLIQFVSQQQPIKWVHVEQLQSDETIRLFAEDVSELQKLAVLTKDMKWFKQLENAVYK